MITEPDTGLTMFARVKVPPLLPRFLTVSKYRFVPLEDVIAAHLTELFTGLEILEHHVFRVTRARELEVDEDVTEDLMQSLERELLRRRTEPPVRLEVEESISAEVLNRLVTELGVDRRAVYHLPGPLDLTGLNAIADLDVRRLKYPAFVPSEAAFPHDGDVFSTLDKQDVLVHHPYDSFTATVERLTVEAAADPRVLAIKQTLYRTSDSSPIVDALIDAAEAGKQVVVVVELKARFDERANILWARKLEQAGCHVVYGFVDLKTHCKMALVVREEPDGSLRRYCHIGTGNYNSSTARLYEDYGLLTSDPDVGGDATDLFNVLTGYSRKTSYDRFLVAPYALRAGLLEQIERQTARQRDGQPARIQLKCNAIVDEAVVNALYRASRAGVPVQLVGPRHLLAAAGPARAVGEHPGAQHPGPLPGALADLCVRDPGRPRGESLDRQRRPHAPEPGPPGRAALLGEGARSAAGAQGSGRRGHGRGHQFLVAVRRRHLDQASPGRRREAPARPAGVPAGAARAPD